MEFIYTTVGILLILGITVAIFELRRGRTFKIERLGNDLATDATREQIRIEDALRDRTYLDNGH